MTTTLDDKISELFAVLTKQKQEVAEAVAASQRKWKTTCSFYTADASHPMNIQTLADKAVMQYVAELLAKEEYMTKAYKLMDDKWDRKVHGFLVEDWLDDFKTRLAKIQLVSKQEKLNKLEARLDAIVSPEQRRMLEVEALTKELVGE